MSGNEVNAMPTDPFDKLIKAIAAADLAAVATLIRSGADVNRADHSGVTVLAHAIATSRLDIVRHLIDAGADVNEPSRPATDVPELAEPALPLVIAAVQRRCDISSYLAPLTRPKLRKDGVKQFRRIKRRWNKKLLRDPRVTALMAAARTGDTASVAMLLANKVDFRAGDEYGNTALAYAALDGHVEVVQLLLQAGADPDAELDATCTPLMAVSNAAVAKLLIGAGADPNRLIEGSTPLSGAAQRNSLEVAAVLLAAGAKPDALTIVHGCALSTAVAKGHLELSRLLIESGASVNFRPKGGWPPLMYAASCGREAIISTLVAAGADIHFRDHDGDTPLTVAKDHPRIVELLQQAGAKE
jgi:ankyrin repeat protein